jgi:hypothetical protein
MQKIIRKSVLAYLSLLAIFTVSCQSNKINIFVENNSSQVMTTAANELQSYLQRSFPKDKFEIKSEVNQNEGIILRVDNILDPEEYVVTNKGSKAIIAGGSPRGVLNGVYGILKKLGCSFYLSFENTPQRGKFSYSDWQSADKPLKGNRIIFNWHNFLSGCTGWDFEQWQQWIDNSSKIGFNTIMVHAYGNNPMQSFTFNGQEKELGYLTTTQKGRDWGTQHVNDVRMMYGGKIFTDYEFGSGAAKVPEDKRSSAATALMQQVFKHAAIRGMNVCFAIDVDTWMANPQNIINTLPKEALVEIGGYNTVNPDHPEGKKYYQAQIKKLFADYPEITMLAAWMREPVIKPGQGSIWLQHDSFTLPEKWKKEYFDTLKKHPELKDERPYPGLFAISKIVKVYREILDEIKPEVELVLGSWRMTYPGLADPFIPEYCGFIPLDYSYVLDQPEVVESLSKVGEHRKLYPVVWAHHDDHSYIGRPYKPFSNFNSLLNKMNARGYGIIHWTTHPLDMLFNNYENQVWKKSENETLEKASDNLAGAMLKKEDKNLVTYYREWFSNAPMFGRETTDIFIRLQEDFSLHGYKSSLEVAEKAKNRLKILESVNKSALNDHGKNEYGYQVGMEKFIISFFTNHHNGHQAFLMLQEGMSSEVLPLVGKLDPQETIKLYAQTISEYGPSRGEEGVLISMNLRWLPDYIDLMQRAGAKPVRINFQPTSHDPLAQGAGRNTFYIDRHKDYWLSLGEKELGTRTGTNGNLPLKEVTDSWIIISGETAIPLKTIRSNRLGKSEYVVEVIFAAQSSGGNVQILEDGKVTSSFAFEKQSNRAKGRLTCNGGEILIKIIPEGGDVKPSGLIVTREQ